MRHLHISGLAATAAAALLGLTLIASPAGARLPDRDVRTTMPVPTTATVTADQLGQDSVIAVVSRYRSDKPTAPLVAQSLEVITPDGVRRPVYSVAIETSRRGYRKGYFALNDWRPELHTALLRVVLGRDGEKLVSYDLTTGALREMPAPPRAATVALSPDGSGVLFTTYPSPQGPGRVGVVGWDGVKTWLPAKATGEAITSADGRTLVTVDKDRWWVTDLTARTSTSVATRGYCSPRRWADADSVVASCSNRRGSQLRLVDLDGSSAPLGIRHTMQPPPAGPPVMDDNDVRTVQGRDYYESYGGCGGAFLTRQTPAGAVKRVRVPGDEGALSLIGTRGDELVVAHIDDDCGSPAARSVLSLFDPVARDETHLTVLRRPESWTEVIAAAEVRSWIW